MNSCWVVTRETTFELSHGPTETRVRVEGVYRDIADARTYVYEELLTQKDNPDGPGCIFTADGGSTFRITPHTLT